MHLSVALPKPQRTIHYLCDVFFSNHYKFIERPNTLHFFTAGNRHRLSNSLLPESWINQNFLESTDFLVDDEYPHVPYFLTLNKPKEPTADAGFNQAAISFKFFAFKLGLEVWKSAIAQKSYSAFNNPIPLASTTHRLNFNGYMWLP